MGPPPSPTSRTGQTSAGQNSQTKVLTETAETLREADEALQFKEKMVPGGQKLDVGADAPAALPSNPVQQSFQLKTAGPETVSEETPHFTETRGRSGNVTWGEKHGKTGNWKERWLTQYANGAETAFGRASGEDLDASRVWDNDWQKDKFITKTSRRVVQFDSSATVPLENDSEHSASQEFQTLKKLPGSAVREVWEETTEFDERTGISHETVVGTDKRGEESRYWRRKRSVLKGKSEGEADVVLSSLTQEIAGPVKRGREETVSSDHRETKFVETYENEATGEVWQSEWTEKVDQTRKGMKRGINERAEKWKEEWSESPKGKAVKQWKENESGDVKWGITTGWGLNSEGIREEFTEHWNKERREVVLEDGTSAIREEELADKWWIRPEQNDRWGEKGRVIITTLPEGQKQTSVELRERWFDNGSEKKTDNWSITQTFNEEGDVVRASHEGHVNGERYTEGTHWGENWGEEFQLVPQEGEVDAEGSEAPAPRVLTSAVRHDGKWWRESTGNSWGEKCYQAKLENKKFEEKWYKNAEGESQIDRWHTEPDGTQWGTKLGNKWEDGEFVTWKENWGEKSGEEKWIEKSWEKARDGQVTHAWGEKSQVEGAAKWFEKWSKSGEEETAETFRDDGLGNTEACKTGTKRRDGVVVDWFVDRFGERLGDGEKWAFKEGADADNNRWTEKWNETPSRKTAEKSGRNAQGDEWSEKWDENFNEAGGKDRTAAFKTGKNARGDAWHEEWVETAKEKWTKKIGSNAEGTKWEESWGEEYNQDGGAKWTSKWTSDSGGNKWGQSWGDRWTSGGGHRWGEEWDCSGDRPANVTKWAYDTAAGDHPDLERP